MREAVYYTADNLKSGGRYVIGEKKYNQEIEDWEVVAIQRIGKDPQPVPVARSEKIDVDPSDKDSVLSAIEEFTNTDIELGPAPAENFDYFELLAEVKRLGVEVSGNPKRVELEKLYNEATG